MSICQCFRLVYCVIDCQFILELRQEDDSMNNINYIRLGEKIRTVRKEQGFTQEQLAEICDISTGFLGHIERGTRKLSLDTLFSIAMVLDVSIDYLLIDSASKSDNFLQQIDSVARSKNPSAYNTFRKTARLLAEHLDEL